MKGEAMRLGPGTHRLWILACVVVGFSKTVRNLLVKVGFLNRVHPRSVLSIEAGPKGWESIEFQEISQSAREYLREDRVVDLVIEPGSGYLRQVRRHLAKTGPTHYFYDPRTASQHQLVGILQALCVTSLLTFFGVIPIGYGTDIGLRRHRRQLAIVTAQEGVLVCFMKASIVLQDFPHERVVGPSLMPFSRKTFDDVSKMLEAAAGRREFAISFVGSLYEPRTSLLHDVQKSLAEQGIQLEIVGRKPGAARTPNSQYWQTFVNSEISITTTSQIHGAGLDFEQENQLVYRTTEALVCGSVLVAEHVEGFERYFEEGRHLLTFRTPMEATEIIQQLTSDESKLRVLQQSGRDRIEELIYGQVFWKTLDSVLGADSMDRPQSF